MFRPSSILLISTIATRSASFRAVPLSFLSLAHQKQNTHHHSIIAKCCGAHQQLSCHLTRLWATVVPQEDRQLLKPIDALTCKLCKRSFSSRNAIFRHLRGEDADESECYIKASEMGMQGAKASKEKEILKTAVIRYGYIINDKEALTSLDKSRDVQYRTGVNDIVANRIHDAFVNLTNAVFEEQSTSVDLTTSALSWSTSAKLRQPSLRQDDEVMGAASEVLSFNYRLVVPQTSNQWNDYVKSGKLLEALQAALDNGVDGNNVQIQLHALDAVLPRSTKFYAERGCSQRSYRFLLPIRWLNFQNSDEDQTQHLIEWVKGVTSTSLTERKHQPRGESARAVPECIMKLKQALKAAESRTVPNRKTRRQNAALDSSKTDANDKTDADYNVDKSSDILVTNAGPIRLSPGRFGQLWRKERRCWSNFCHPELRGMAASPSHDATWRTLDKASIVDIINLTNAEEEDSDVDDLQNVHVVLEFRADGFLLGTIPRLTSTIVAMANGWLPTNFFEVATRPDVYISAPSISPFSNSMLYFHSPRYHFHELSAKSDDDFDSSGSQFESCIDDGLNAYKWEKMLRSKLLARSSFTNTKDESAWLTELRDVISASVKQELQSTINLAEQADDQASLDEQIGFSEVLASCPEGAYSNTVELLRDIVKNEQWPATSMARSRVIKATSSKRSNDSSILTSKKGSVGTAFPGNSQSSGSFTVINVDLWEKDSGVPLPSANTRFPDLAKAVFDLEREIIDSQTPIPTADGMKRASSALRQPSTHCAVNRNAQFTPHVDSGRGLGQSVSMIVGLGDYNGGEVIVEGKPYPIRYNALEFDGWRQLHWTNAFVGERFSLVWFTPDMSKSDRGSKEEKYARNLAAIHNAKTPKLPPLVYRTNSTDSLVIGEILDQEKGCAYSLESGPNMGAHIGGFSVKGHSTILDVGAHIGVFSLYAIEEGCKRIIAYEPEPNNFILLFQNLDTTSDELSIELHPKAVSKGSENRTLVRARAENDGKENTWRHALSEYTQYIDKSTKLPSESQKTNLVRIEVQSVSFFNDALVPGVTFVKLDCEGSEIEILLSSQASEGTSWLDVTHLVVEWSFTKERRVAVFHQMISNLKNAGFEVSYEGMGSWWDVDPNVMWPYPNDLLVFAKMRSGKD